MNVAIITNLRAPYRTLQINEFSKIKNIRITTYYTDDRKDNRIWNVSDGNGFKEIDLDGFNILNKYGYINKGLFSIVRENDLILLCGYEKPTYIILSLICRLLNKPYILIYDGISTNRLNKNENVIKYFIKNIVIKNAKYIMGNGTVSKKYFSEVFGYKIDRIYNQFLAVDSEKINELYKDREVYRKEYRKKLNISENEKVLIYSGRLIDIKNVDAVVKAISKLDRSDMVLLITGGGELENYISDLSKKLNVRTIITGFIPEQDKLFKHYFVGDMLILPSINEPWGLVINEAMSAGLPVLVSEICGCSLDLINNGENGYIIDPTDIEDIKLKIDRMINNKELDLMGQKSRQIIEQWNFKNSAENLKILIKKCNEQISH